jgi:hypothetical protein
MAEESTGQKRYVVGTTVLAYYALNTAPYNGEVSLLSLNPLS